MYEIILPATTANIGPGFDTVGLALNLYNKIYFEEKGKGLNIKGCDEKYNNKDNLIYTSFRETERILNVANSNIEITIKGDIPVSRGLGSSAACVLSGVLGAFLIHNIPINKHKILEIASKIEGHPDNIAPCLFGGLVVSLVNDGKIFTEKYNINDDLFFYSFIPDFHIATAKAREILPEMVKYEDAVYNLSRLPFLISGLKSSDMDLINNSIDDKLHQPYREKLIKEVEEIKDIIIKIDQKSYFVSGAGPTIICISKSKNLEEKFRNEIKNLKNNWQIKKLKADNKGTQYRRLK